MPGWAVQLLAQLVPVIVPLLLRGLQALGLTLPPTMLTGLNGMAGAAMGQAVSGDPLSGAVIAHIAHSALDHSPKIGA